MKLPLTKIDFQSSSIGKMLLKSVVLLLVLQINFSSQSHEDSDEFTSASRSSSEEDDEFERSYEDFKKRFHRKFDDENQHMKSRDCFRKRHLLMKEHNDKFSKGEVTWLMGHNRFSDVPEEDIIKVFGYTPFDDDDDHVYVSRHTHTHVEPFDDDGHEDHSDEDITKEEHSNEHSDEHSNENIEPLPRRRKRSLLFADLEEEADILNPETFKLGSLVEALSPHFIVSWLKPSQNSKSKLPLEPSSTLEEDEVLGPNFNSDEAANFVDVAENVLTTEPSPIQKKDEALEPEKTTIEADQAATSPDSVSSVNATDKPSRRRRRDVEIPQSKDWRDEGAVTEVFDQGDCAGCWSFSAVGSFESHYYLKHKHLHRFSSQLILDCCDGSASNGCSKGSMHAAFKFLEEIGTTSNKRYPFIQKDGQCYDDKIKRRVKIKTHYKLKSEDDILEIVGTVGPVAIGLDASTLPYYKSGVFKVLDCGQTVNELNHAVLIVGYGSENGVDYWICKNSWGTSWGEDGYFRILRGENMCGLATIGRYPVF